MSWDVQFRLKQFAFSYDPVGCCQRGRYRQCQFFGKPGIVFGPLMIFSSEQDIIKLINDSGIKDIQVDHDFHWHSTTSNTTTSHSIYTLRLQRHLRNSNSSNYLVSVYFLLPTFLKQLFFPFFRVSPPAEFCTTSFNQMPEIHTFPLAAVNKSVNIKSLSHTCLRLPLIPNPVCYELSDKQPCRLQGPSVLKENDLFGVNDALLRRSNSPRRFDKPNILHSLTVQELEMLSNSPPYVDHGPMFEAPLSHECCNSNHNCHQVNSEAIQQSRFPICKQPTLSSDTFVHDMPKETGAIPKRPSLQLHSIPEVCLSKPHLSPQEVKYNQFTSRMSPKSQMEVKFKDLIIHNRLINKWLHRRSSRKTHQFIWEPAHFERECW